MKLFNGNARDLAWICAVMVIGILVYFFISGLAQPVDRYGQGLPENTTQIVPLTTDASFDISEADVKQVSYINISHVTNDQLQIYPELEKNMHGVNNDPGVWHSGWRFVKTFEGNTSRYDRLITEVCKGKTIFECNRGTLFEYHNQYYKVSIREHDAMPRDPDR
jgi:hypothetical protein